MWVEACLLVAAGCLLYQYVFKPKKSGGSSEFWREHGVRQISNSTLKDKFDVFIGRKFMAQLDSVAYSEMKKSGESYIGIIEMQSPVLILGDLEYVKKIMIKDFDHFMDRRSLDTVGTQPIVAKMIGSLHGEEWKGVRSGLSPTFTTGKIRRMMECFNQVSFQWMEHFRGQLETAGNPGFIDVNIPKETTRYTVDVIAASVFGMKTESISNPDSAFSRMTRRLSEFSTWTLIKFGIVFNFPRIASILRMKVIDQEALDFFERILSQGMKERLDGTVRRNDFLQLMAEARKGEIKAVGSDDLGEFEKDALLVDKDGREPEAKKNWLADDLTANAQMIGFFFAGFSTTSNFVGFCLYSLAAHPEVQEKLREEVTHLFRNGKDQLDHDELNQCQYLEMFTCEVLRHQPPLGRLERICTKDYVEDPNSGNLRVPKGALVVVPTEAIHHDPEHYERPLDFYPEHFTPERKSQRSPYAFLPFGTGPRNCIGMRFALVKSKAAVAHMVYNFRIEPSPKTPIPMKVKYAGFGVQLPDNLELRLSSVKR